MAYRIRTVDGSVSAPAWRFDEDTDTGVYRIGPDELGIATGGIKRVGLSTAGLTLSVPLAKPDDASTLALCGGSDSSSGATIELSGDAAASPNRIDFKVAGAVEGRMDSGIFSWGTSTPHANAGDGGISVAGPSVFQDTVLFTENVEINGANSTLKIPAVNGAALVPAAGAAHDNKIMLAYGTGVTDANRVYIFANGARYVISATLG